MLLVATVIPWQEFGSRADVAPVAVCDGDGVLHCGTVDAGHADDDVDGGCGGCRVGALSLAASAAAAAVGVVRLASPPSPVPSAGGAVASGRLPRVSFLPMMGLVSSDKLCSSTMRMTTKTIGPPVPPPPPPPVRVERGGAARGTKCEPSQEQRGRIVRGGKTPCGLER